MKRILGIDHGQARIGVAMSDELQMLAHPVETIALKPGVDAVKRIGEIVRQHNIDNIVVGVPRHMSGATGVSAENALAFCEKLRAAIGCKVIPWDERMTTLAAHRALHESGRKVKDSRHVIDQVAAQMILQGYLDRLAANLSS